MTNKDTPLRVPVTDGLKDMYAMDMRLPYQAACAGEFNVTAFGRLAAAIAVVRTALVQKDAGVPDAIQMLDAAIETLSTVRARGDETDVWEITEAERPAILQAIDAAEQCIGILDVALLENTAQLLAGQMLPTEAQPEG